ncbi:MAG: MarR family winged helix-turn-helix transcriptional regulator [bacterium]
MSQYSDGDLARQMLSFFIRVNNWLRCQIQGQAAALGGSLTPAQFKTLFMIRRMQPCMMSVLSERSHVSTSSLTIMLNKLVGESLVERLSDPADRRVVRVRLTPQGAELLRQMEMENLRLLEARLSALTPPEKERLADLLPEISHLLDNSEGGSQK